VDLTLSPSEQAFRDELRSWLADNHPGEPPRGDDEDFEFRREWQRRLHEAGYAGLSWPEEFGGRGATPVEQAIFGEEMARARAPSPVNILGLVMGGPVVIAHGTEEQKQRYLEPILSAQEIWCQGFSEPDSGSDLASLKTRAVRSNGEWVVTGQKVWTTYARKAKWCMLVARTDQDAPKHQGLTYFLMDMEQDAVQVRPLRQITGEAEFNELFMEEARIPDEHVVGGVGNGWSVAITTLMHERAGLGAANAISVRVALGRLVELAREREVLVVEDNPYGLLRYDGEPQPTLYSLDGGDYVLYLGTLSKILSPGIRIGWVAAPPPVLEKIGLGKQAADLCTSTLAQYFVREYFGEGRWREYIADLVGIYRTRRDAMLDALERHFPERSVWTSPEGGLFLWATLPDYIDTTDLLAKALRENVAFVPGRSAYVDGRGGSSMRLNFSASGEAELREGIRRIGAVVSEQMTLYETITGEHRVPPPEPEDDEPGGDVVPIPRRR
jgi:alkylation response protein AidB-like acyl-CoA dehydrogenase